MRVRQTKHGRAGIDGIIEQRCQGSVQCGLHIWTESSSRIEAWNRFSKAGVGQLPYHFFKVQPFHRLAQAGENGWVEATGNICRFRLRSRAVHSLCPHSGSHIRLGRRPLFEQSFLALLRLRPAFCESRSGSVRTCRGYRACASNCICARPRFSR